MAIGCRYEHNLFNLKVIRNPQNMVYGGSQKIAYQHSIDKGYKGVAMSMATPSTPPNCWASGSPRFSRARPTWFSVADAGRSTRRRHAAHRYLGNRFLTWIQNRFLGTRLSEFHSGYRVYSTEALRKVPFVRLSSDYHFDTEIIILLQEYGLKIAEVPIPTHDGDEKNYVNIWKYGIDVLATTISYFLHNGGWRKSARWTKILGMSSLPRHVRESREARHPPSPAAGLHGPSTIGLERAAGLLAA